MKKALLVLPMALLAAALFVPSQSAGAYGDQSHSSKHANGWRSKHRSHNNKQAYSRKSNYTKTDRQKDDCKPSKTIAETLSSKSQFSTLVTALSQAGLVDTFNGSGDFTVFAPTNEAFAKLGQDTLNAVLADPVLLKNVLTYHVVDPSAVPTSVPSKVAITLTSAPMLNGKSVTIKTMDGSLYINDAKVIMKDIKTSNGIIHAIDTVLVP